MTNTIAQDIDRAIEALRKIKATLKPRYTPVDRDYHLVNHENTVNDAGRVREVCTELLVAVAHSVLNEVGEVPRDCDIGRFRAGSHDDFNDLTLVDLDTVLADMEAA